MLLALILAALLTVLLSGSGGNEALSAVRPVTVGAESHDWNTEVSMGSMTTRVR